MKKDTLTTTLKTLYSTRQTGVIMSLIFAFSAIYALWTTIVIQASDTQVVTRYTIYGLEHMFKEQWYALYTLPVLALAIALCNAAIIARLIRLEKVPLARAFGWLTFAVLIVLAAHTYQIMHVAFP